MDANDPGPPVAADLQPQGLSPRAYLEVLRNTSFRNLSLATLSSTLGDWIGFLAILALTESILGQTRAAAFAVSAVMAARVLPSMLLGPIAGVFVDRWDRKRLMIACDIGRAAIMALIPFSNEILTLLLATLVIEVLSSLFGPAKDSVLPSLVRPDRLVLANQVNLMVTYGTLPLGGVLFAAMLAVAGPASGVIGFLDDRPVALPIWFNALSFLMSAALLSRLQIAERPRHRGGADEDGDRAAVDEPPGAWQELREGFAFVGGHPIIRALILGVMLAAGSAGVVISTGQFFANVLNAGSQGFGILVGIVGVGLLLGLIVTAPVTTRVAPERLFGPGIALAGLMLIATALMPSLRWAAPTAMLMGAGAGVGFIVGYTILQSRADERIRGRTFGAFNSGVRVAIFGSTTAAPFLVGVLGRERRELVALQDGTRQIVYPYAIGGVRLTLILGGLLAVIGAVFAGRALARSLSREQQAGVPSGGAPAAHEGLFVVFEGGDGSGKTTQIRLLRSAIERLGATVAVSREPGGTPIGETVRDVLLSPDHDRMGDRTEALLYAAARAQHVDEVIEPALTRGEVVLCDRFLDSSVVYQGAGRGLGEEPVETLNRWATDDLVPDLVVLLDLDPDEGLRRVGDVQDRLEAAGSRFHRTVAEAYRRRAADEPDRYLVVDATEPVEQLHAAIRRAVIARMARRGLVDATPASSGGGGTSDAAGAPSPTDAADAVVAGEPDHDAIGAVVVAEPDDDAVDAVVVAEPDDDAGARVDGPAEGSQRLFDADPR